MGQIIFFVIKKRKEERTPEWYVTKLDNLIKISDISETEYASLLLNITF